MARRSKLTPASGDFMVVTLTALVFAAVLSAAFAAGAFLP
jgi:hypothetical protein